MSGSYIATTTEDDVQWLMAAGQSLGLSVAQLRHHLTQNLSPAHGALLAEPVEDVAGRATDWYGAGEGDATPLDQLPPGPRAVMTNRVWALLRDIRAEGVRLAAAADSDERVLGAMLDKVSHVPDLGCVRVRGDDPLVIAWAHGRAGQSVDLSQVFKPVDVPPTRSVPDAAASPQRGIPSWLVPVLVVASVVLAVGLIMWLQRQPSETVPTSESPRPPPIVLANPAPSSATAQAPQARPDTTVRTAISPVTEPSPAPAPRQESTPVTPPPPVQNTGATPPTITSSTTLTDQYSAAPLAPAPDTKPTDTKPPDTKPPAASSITEHNEQTEAAQATRSDTPSPPPSPTPNPSASPVPVESPPLAPTRTATAQLPPHEAEASAALRPFTAASVHKHDLAMLQGCWTLSGEFASADVQTHAPAKIGQWRTCFAPPQSGAATLAGTQSLEWQDGKSCSGPVTARFLSDDKLEIADAADCLGDRTLLRMSEQCARKDDATMTCAWTAHELHGDGLTLTPTH